MEATAAQELDEDKQPMLRSKRIQLTDITKQEDDRERNITSCCCRSRNVRLITSMSVPLMLAEALKFLRKFVFNKKTNNRRRRGN